MAPRLAIPQTADELHEILNSDAQLMDVMSDPDSLRNFLKNYVKTSAAKNPDITAEVKEQAERIALEYLRTNGVEDNVKGRINLDPYSKRVPKNTLYNKSAAGAKYDNYFDNVSNFLYSISDHSHVDNDLSKKLGHLKNDLSSIRPSDGGFLIPENLRAELLQVAMETAIVRSRARVIPMDSLRVPFPMVDSTSNVSSVYGGITGYWTEEGATLTESQPRFGRVVLEAHKLTLYTEVPNELIRDAQPSMVALIDQMFPEALAWFEDVAFFIGGGVGEPLGFLNANAAISVTRSTATAGDNVEWADITQMFARMLPQSLNRAVWVIAPDVLPSLLQMTVGDFPVMLSNQSAGPGAVGTILGRPVIVSEKAKSVGDAGDINFVDFGFYLIGDRQAMSARQSEDFRFNQDVTAFRVIERIDGRPWLQSAITPQNNSANTLSPFVKLTAA
jgi:HK97 family phage major capsid protein